MLCNLIFAEMRRFSAGNLIICHCVVALSNFGMVLLKVCLRRVNCSALPTISLT